jgi:uncharacterized protein YrrD
MNAKNLKGYKLLGIDNEIGKVEEFYFDDNHWVIRYLVANSGNWLTGRQVLISPYSMTEVVEETENIVVNLTKKQIEESPTLDSDKPVSRQFEKSYQRYYGFPLYWGGAYIWGMYPSIQRDPLLWKEFTEGEEYWDPELRSTREVNGYHIEATDGEVGHVEDFIIDTETWAIRYLVINTVNWWSGKKVLVSPQWIERVSWHDQKVYVNISRDAIKHSMEYTDASLLTREYEADLHQHYQRPGYWDEQLNSIKKNY